MHSRSKISLPITAASRTISKNAKSGTTDQQEQRSLLLKTTRAFYQIHSDLIKESHGILHVESVYDHARHAIESLMNSSERKIPLSLNETFEIEVAALLHDVDDNKYFPPSSRNRNSDNSNSNSNNNNNNNQAMSEGRNYALLYPNAIQVMKEAKIPRSSHETILFMIDVVSCTTNGNTVPERVLKNDSYHLLIPRWSDRIEAVGARGVWRCYQYNQEKNFPLCTPGISPQPTTLDELWTYVTPDRFEQYISTKGKTAIDDSMIGHYYDKLLHVACPPRNIVRNEYLEDKLQDSAKELVDVCLRYGRTGTVDEDYIHSFKHE
mmetsp:Transcript_41855/g.47361  ORF Transcript_41855/g.47361 Transcript_41855/m.47361 type:complete len:322 (-) Transcript_41855:303-1268(-)